MHDYKNLLGALAVIVQLSSYGIYLRGIYIGKIKPHAFTWFAWGTLTSIGFAAQVVSKAGAGSWVMFMNALLCYSIAIIAFRQGHVKYSLFDWIALSGAILGGFLWYVTSNPFFAVILISISDAIGILPTIRKAYYFPNEESIAPWLVGIFTYALSILALNSLVITNWLYPASIMITDFIFVIEVSVRRRSLKQPGI
jgi:hypothetical protein